MKISVGFGEETGRLEHDFPGREVDDEVNETLERVVRAFEETGTTVDCGGEGKGEDEVCEFDLPDYFLCRDDNMSDEFIAEAEEKAQQLFDLLVEALEA